MQRRFSIGLLIIESAAIFLSVFLAFAADQWRDDQNDRDRARAALELVRVELEGNLAELEATSETRADLLVTYGEALDSFIASGVFPTDLPNVNFPEITTIAYALATDSGAVTTVDPDNLIIIARAYEALEDVRQNENFLWQRNAQIRYRDGEQFLSGRVFFASSAVATEPNAIAHVKAALDVL